MSAATPPWSLDTVAWSALAPGRWRLALSLSPSLAPPAIPTPDNIVFTDTRDLPRHDLVVTAVTATGTANLQVDVTVLPPIERDPGSADTAPIVLWLVGLDWIDPARSFAGFIAASSSPFSPGPAPIGSEPPAKPREASDIDLLGRDFEGLKTLMLNHLRLNLTASADLDHLANPVTTLVETLAMAGDYMAYYQDAVATEAYLATARRHASLRRHARLIDYAVDEGCNARAWIRVTPAQSLVLPARTRFVSAQPGVEGPLVAPEQALAAGSVVFETLAATGLDPERESLWFAAPASTAAALPVGATQALLAGSLDWLKPGQILLLEPNPAAWPVAAFTPHPVELVEVEIIGRGDQSVTRIVWALADALPEMVPLTPTGLKAPVRVSANLVLADHGATAASPILLPPVDDPPRYRPSLAWRDICHAEPPSSDPGSAFDRRRQDPRRAAPALYLVERSASPGAPAEGRQWSARRDLLDATPFSRVVAVEPDEADGVRLRFGDGVLGRAAPRQAWFEAWVRRGGGVAGNVAAGFLVQAVTTAPLVAVNNPLPAVGGRSGESNAEIRQFAPQAFRRQRRAVTAPDYVALALENPLVAAAGAEVLDQDGARAFRVVVEPRAPIPAGGAFEAEVTKALAAFHVVGPPFAVAAPQVVGLDIALSVYVRAQADLERVRADLARVFSNQGEGFFSPVRMGLGRSVFLAQIIAAARGVAGVSWIDAESRMDPRVRFGALSPVSLDALASGVVRIAPTQKARADNDPQAPENGRIVFYVMASA